MAQQIFSREILARHPGPEIKFNLPNDLPDVVAGFLEKNEFGDAIFRTLKEN